MNARSPPPSKFLSQICFFSLIFIQFPSLRVFASFFDAKRKKGETDGRETRHIRIGKKRSGRHD
jgi:hypothetical protein